jgi:hypothetical protein
MSVTHNQARDIIIAAFRTGWSSATDVAYDNEQFTPTDSTSAWARFVVHFNGSKQVSIAPSGSRSFRRFGIVSIQIFTSVSDNTFNSDTYANTALSIFEGKVISNVHFYDGGITTVGVDGKWYQQNVVIYFYFDEIK